MSGRAFYVFLFLNVIDRNLRSFLIKGSFPSEKDLGTFRCSRKRFLTSVPTLLRPLLLLGPNPLLTLPTVLIAPLPMLFIVFNVHVAVFCTSVTLVDVSVIILEIISAMSVTDNDPTKPVYRHFNSPDHSISDLIVFGLPI